MKPIVVRTLCRLLLLAPGALVVLAPGTAGFASETNPLKVYGDDRPALQAAIRYWNGLGHRELFRYAGERVLRRDPSTVIIGMGDLDEHSAGRAAGLVGATPIVVTVRFAFVNEWVVYAHELGHALGFPDYDEYGDTSPYNGVMSHVDMWDRPNVHADEALMNERQGRRSGRIAPMTGTFDPTPGPSTLPRWKRRWFLCPTQHSFSSSPPAGCPSG